jgi:hypothetical protein
MGVYVYTVRNKFVNVEDLGKAHLIKFLCRLGNLGQGCWNKTPSEKAYDMQLIQAENRWFGRDMPEYVVLADKFKDGAAVFRYSVKSPIWYDCDPVGELAGYLDRRKVGRKVEWHVRTREQQELINRCEFAHEMDQGKASIKLDEEWVTDGDTYLKWCQKRDEKAGTMRFDRA